MRKHAALLRFRRSSKFRWEAGDDTRFTVKISIDEESFSTPYQLDSVQFILHVSVSPIEPVYSSWLRIGLLYKQSLRPPPCNFRGSFAADPQSTARPCMISCRHDSTVLHCRRSQYRGRTGFADVVERELCPLLCRRPFATLLDIEQLSSRFLTLC